MGFLTYFNGGTILLFCLIWISIILILHLKKKKSFVYLIFVTIFYFYIAKVLDYTLIQFQSLLLLKYFVPELMLQGQEHGKALNLIPLLTLTGADLKTSLLNILLFVPFGFGLPFITSFRMKKVVVVGLLLSVAIEFLQFVTGFIANTTFRIADINDLIFNTIGVTVGYMFFIVFVHVYRYITRNWETPINPILRYIAERPQVNT
jgi:glycopeptide antibiotics resistance protein